ncbi:Protein-export membrane protein SecF [subsurface metagenome]
MKRVIHFTDARFLMLSLSLLLILAGAAGLYLRGGFNLGIDFTAGLTERILINPQAADASIDRVRQALADIGRLDLQIVGSPKNQEFIVKVIAPADDRSFQRRMEAQILNLLSESFGQENIEFKQSDFVGPRYSRDLVGQTISITMVALVLILIYTAFRFHFIYAAAAVICLIHDVLIMFGVLVVFQFELTTTTSAAVLTIIGYSLNDTIVIFDRIRENRALMRDADFVTIINTSITQSLSRTLLTSLTTLFAVAAIYVFGSTTIKLFALSLIIGVVVGTYSTIFIASPIVLGWQLAIERRRKKRDLQKYGRKAAAPTAAVISAGARAQEGRVPVSPSGGAAAASAPPPAPSSPAEGREEPGEKAPSDKPEGKLTVTRTQPTRTKPRKKKKKKKR